MKWLTQIYALLLRLYPASFRDEFGEEMTAVFTQALSDIQQQGWLPLLIWCGREFTGLLTLLIREQWLSLRREEAIMNQMLNVNHVDDADDTEAKMPVSWAETMAGILPFILFGLMFTLEGLNYHVPSPRPWLLRRYWQLIVHAILLIGLGVGWAKNFPRWSYAYLGVTLMTAYWMEGVTTVGLQLFGYTFGREHWGWRGWVPLLILTAVMLLLTRSLRPLAQLVRGIWRDWTLLSFGLYGAITWIIMLMSLDNKSWYNNTIYLSLNMFLLTLVFTGGAIFYMRWRRPWRRVMALQLAIILYPPVSAAVEALDGNYLSVSPDSVVGWLFLTIIWFGAMFMPGVLGLVHRAVRSNHFA